MVNDLAEFIANAFGPFMVAAVGVAFAGVMILMIITMFMRMFKRWLA